jgi:hypothetical protein
MFYLKPPRHISTLPIATEMACSCNVRFPLESDRLADILVRQLRATNRLMLTSKSHRYSIISSARASSAGGRVRLSAFAVFRLIKSWNLVA